MKGGGIENSVLNFIKEGFDASFELGESWQRFELRGQVVPDLGATEMYGFLIRFYPAFGQTKGISISGIVAMGIMIWVKWVG